MTAYAIVNPNYKGSMNEQTKGQGNPITLTINVDAATAVRLGKGRAGPIQIRLSDAELAQLSKLQRETLAKHLELEGCRGNGDDPQWGDPLAMHAPPVGEATLDVLRSLLDTRRKLMEALGHGSHPARGALRPRR